MQSERAKFCLEEPWCLFHCCDPVEGWKTGLGAGTHVLLCFILAVCWAQHSLGWVGFRAAGGGLGCCAPSVPFVCSVGSQQCWDGSVDPADMITLLPCGASLGAAAGKSLGTREVQNSYTGWVYSGCLQIVMEETAPKWHFWLLWFCSKCYSTT